MRFEWDDRKARSNAIKHGVTFEQALTARDDPERLILDDPKHSTIMEHREKIVAETDAGILLVVITRRHAGTSVRLISARRANRNERKAYAESTSADG